MIVVDAAGLYEVVSRGALAEEVSWRLESDSDFVAPHVIDVEVLNAIRRDHMRGLLDATAARLAVDELRDWAGIRLGHQPLLTRAWELRNNVRGWDAFYVALAEMLGATLLTLDGRLSRAPGLRCPIEVVR
jgi:predicted nucleic acid-binding protein